MKSIFIFSLFISAFLSCTTKDQNNAISPENVDMRADSEPTETIQETYDLIFSWEGEFTNEEQEKVKAWITEIHSATNKTLGQYRFDVYVNIIRSDSKNRPVPFGFARRSNGQNQVHLYVNPTASYDELLLDWTAQHEFSHLSLLYLGKRNKWFSEGFATFLSRQTMMDQGLYTQTEFDSLYHSKITDAKPYYNSSTKTFIEVSDSLMDNHSYGNMYWGSSTFLFTIDKRLRKERDMRFVDVMKDYQPKYRDGDKRLKDVIQSFDKVIGESWCWDLMVIYRNEPSYKVMENY
ncbi:MAG: hypothetical protein GQ574_25075 [Crocinitomix sp.]|nr:hypothetical protein [Crocinitomix sp.]